MALPACWVQAIFFVGFARLASWSMKSHIMLAQTLCAALALSAMGRRLQQDNACTYEVHPKP